MFNKKKKPEINFQKEYFFILLVHKSHLLYEGEFVLFIMMRFQIKNKKNVFSQCTWSVILLLCIDVLQLQTDVNFTEGVVDMLR